MVWFWLSDSLDWSELMNTPSVNTCLDTPLFSLQIIATWRNWCLTLCRPQTVCLPGQAPCHWLHHPIQTRKDQQCSWCPVTHLRALYYCLLDSHIPHFFIRSCVVLLIFRVWPSLWSNIPKIMLTINFPMTLSSLRVIFGLIRVILFIPLLLDEFHKSPLGGHMSVVKTYCRIKGNFFCQAWNTISLSICRCVLTINTPNTSLRSPLGYFSPFPHLLNFGRICP